MIGMPELSILFLLIFVVYPLVVVYAVRHTMPKAAKYIIATVPLGLAPLIATVVLIRKVWYADA